MCSRKKISLEFNGCRISSPCPSPPLPEPPPVAAVNFIPHSIIASTWLCAGDWSEKKAFFTALETWPKDVRPAVHWSESQADRRPFAHSDYIQGPMNLHGKEADVDVMIEAKFKERTLLKFRDETMRQAQAGPSAELVENDSAADVATSTNIV